MAVLRNSAGDPARHGQVIEALARENSAPVEHVRELFETDVRGCTPKRASRHLYR